MKARQLDEIHLAAALRQGVTSEEAENEVLYGKSIFEYVARAASVSCWRGMMERTWPVAPCVDARVRDVHVNHVRTRICRSHPCVIMYARVHVNVSCFL